MGLSAIPIIGGIVELGKIILGGMRDYILRQQERKKAEHETVLELIKSKQSHNQAWELRSLMNVGAKDEVLFYGVIAMFVYSAIDPDGAKKVFDNWQQLPAWFTEIFGWLVASIIGVKKLGDYLPRLIQGVKTAIKPNNMKEK